MWHWWGVLGHRSVCVECSSADWSSPWRLRRLNQHCLVLLHHWRHTTNKPVLTSSLEQLMAKQWTWNTSSKAWPSLDLWLHRHTWLHYNPAPFVYFSSSQWAVFWDETWKWMRHRASICPVVLRGFYNTDWGMGGGGECSTHLEPSHLSLPREAECDNQCFPAASAQGLQNHRRIMNATHNLHFYG